LFEDRRFRKARYNFNKFNNTEIYRLFFFSDLLLEVVNDNKLGIDALRQNILEKRVKRIGGFKESVRVKMKEEAHFKESAEHHFEDLRLRVGQDVLIDETDNFIERRPLEEWKKFVDPRDVDRNAELMEFTTHLSMGLKRRRDWMRLMFHNKIN
jgi:hypothetical protein